MKPLFRILAEKKDITALIADRLKRLTVTDKAGFSSDTASIVLDDRDNKLEMPRKGAELDIYMGTDESGLSFMGLFTVDNVTISGPPDTISITAKAAEMRGGLKEKRVLSYENITIEDLVAIIAARHRLTPKVDPFLGRLWRSHIAQNNESDLNLLTRLAKDYGAVAKAANGCLIFVSKGQAKSVTGKKLSPVEIKKEDLSSWNFSFPDRDQYKSVVAMWRDADAAKDMEVKVGEGEPVFRLPKHFPNEAEAKEAAKARFDKMSQEKAAGSLALASGNALVLAETPITLPDMRPEIATPTWAVDSTTHLIAGTYTTKVEIKTKI